MNRENADSRRNPELDDFYARLQQEISRTRPDEESMEAALSAVQDLDVEAESERKMHEKIQHLDPSGRICSSCGNRNRESNKFCAMCGAPLAGNTKSEISRLRAPEHAIETPKTSQADVAQGEHHYHHHYHHHFFQASPQTGFQETSLGPRFSPAERPTKDVAPARAPLSGPAMSRAETSVRKLTQDLALACNTKQLDDVVDLYTADGLLMRPNTLPIRGSAAIREFFFTALDSGLGEMELETLRVEIVGDTAYDAGRYKVLAPFAMGQRREERGKYLIMYERRSAGEWKIMADCWSSDLTLSSALETDVGRTSTVPPRPGIPRKSA